MWSKGAASLTAHLLLTVTILSVCHSKVVYQWSWKQSLGKTYGSTSMSDPASHCVHSGSHAFFDVSLGCCEKHSQDEPRSTSARGCNLLLGGDLRV